MLLLSADSLNQHFCCNNFYYAQNKNYYELPQPINATITFDLKTSGHVNYDGDVIGSSKTGQIIMTIQNGKITLNKTSVGSYDASTSKSNNTSASISNVKMTIN